MGSLKRNWVEMTAEEYHAAPGLSSSALRCFVLEGELAYYNKYVLRRGTSRESDALRLGKLFHLGMERPADWQDEVLIVPPAVPDPLDQIALLINAGTSSAAAKLIPGAAWNEKLSSHRQYRDVMMDMAKAQGKHFIRHSEFEQVKSQINAVWDNHLAREILTGNHLQSEMACFAETSKLPFKLKALLDNHYDDCVVDFKTTRFLNWADFIRDGYRKGYHYQMAYYCLVTGLKRAKIIAITNEPPYEANVFVMGKDRIRQLIEGDPHRSDGLKDHIKKIAEKFYSLSLQASITTDSEGVPLEWHHERWGKPIPFDPAAATGAELPEDSEDQ